MSGKSSSLGQSSASTKPSRLPLVAAAVALLALAGVAVAYRLRMGEGAGDKGVAKATVPSAQAARPVPTTAAARQAAAVVRLPPPVASTALATAPASASAAGAVATEIGPRSEAREGDVFEGTVTGLGSRGDGRVRLRGKTVYIPGTKEGDTVRYRVARDMGSFFVGEKVASDVPLTTLAAEKRHASSDAPVVAPATDLPKGVLDGVTSKAEAVQVDAQFSVVITEKDRFNPDKNGACRIGGFVVIVADVQPGPDRVRIRITERLERRANAVAVQ